MYKGSLSQTWILQIKILTGSLLIFYCLIWFLTATQKQTASPEQIKNKESHENLDSVIRNQVGRQVDRVFVCTRKIDKLKNTPLQN